MSQTEEFEKIVEAAKANKGGVVFVTGKPGSGKSKVLREAAEDKKWDYVDCRMLISEDFLAVPGDQRMEKAPELMGATLDSYNSDVILGIHPYPRRRLHHLERGINVRCTCPRQPQRCRGHACFWHQIRPCPRGRSHSVKKEV